MTKSVKRKNNNLNETIRKRARIDDTSDMSDTKDDMSIDTKDDMSIDTESYNDNMSVDSVDYTNLFNGLNQDHYTISLFRHIWNNILEFANNCF